MIITQESTHRDLDTVEHRPASFSDGGRELSLVLATLDARAALERAQEDAAIEAQDVLMQADEALVVG